MIGLDDRQPYRKQPFLIGLTWGDVTGIRRSVVRLAIFSVGRQRRHAGLAECLKNEQG
jgi:hypothetical protein